MEPRDVIADLSSVAGAQHVRPLSTASARALVPQGWGAAAPVAEVAPGSVEEVAATTRCAEQAGAGIIPCGGSTQLQIGYPPAGGKPLVLLRTTRLDRVLDHQPDDMTVTCQAGVTITLLQRALAHRQQFLPIDVPMPDRATVGGVVAANAAGFWRAAYGPPRDLVIGVRAVMSGGVQVKGGGKVVKNVAGYDVCKLFTGSWGTLGVITEVTFKVRPLPETQQTLAWETDDLASAAQMGFTASRSPLALTFVLATNAPRPRVIAGMHGSLERVRWQELTAGQSMTQWGATSRSRPVSSADLGDLRDRLARAGARPEVAARVTCLPSDLPEFAGRLGAIPGVRVTADCALGIVHLTAPGGSGDTVLAVQGALPEHASIVWTRRDGCAPDLTPAWGEPREEHFLHRALKHALDPANTFSPGRFVGGI